MPNAPMQLFGKEDLQIGYAAEDVDLRTRIIQFQNGEIRQSWPASRICGPALLP